MGIILLNNKTNTVGFNCSINVYVELLSVIETDADTKEVSRF